MHNKLFLAPMDGVTDYIMRDLLTKIGGIDYCVSEFLRVTDSVFSDKVFFEHCPELKTNSATTNGIPVFLQLLGNNPEFLARNAQRAADLGALGIDLNFGCPAKTVNKHNGGSVLLKNPEILFTITKAVRAAVPKNVPVSAKIRLGYEDANQCLENVKALEEAGANWITVHCRTKVDGYKPPAYWEWIPRIKEITSLPIVANGEINSVEDFFKCKQVTHCSQFMIGRASLADPFIFLKIKNSLMRSEDQPTQQNIYKWNDVANKLLPYYQISENSVHGSYAVARTKQWLKYLTKTNSEAHLLFEKIKTINHPGAFKSCLENHLMNLL
jgi:tRNA-dihydrouridine synthase C